MPTNIIKARLSKGIENRSIADVISSEPDERRGYMARFAPVTAGTVKDYDGVVEWDEAAVKPIELLLNQKRYFAFSIGDIEELKTNKRQIDKTTNRQSREIVMDENRFHLKTLAAGAGKTIERTVKDPETAYDMIVDANKELSILDAPFDERYIIIDHRVLGMLEKDDRFTKYEKILSNGVLEGTSINGARLIVTNALPDDTALAVQKDGSGFARFLDEVETMRLQNAFADGVRGLNVYDSKVLDKNCIVKVSLAAAATK